MPIKEQKQHNLKLQEEIIPQCLQWKQVQYFLRMSYSNLSIRLKSLDAITSKLSEEKFLSKQNNKLVISAILTESDLSKQNKNQDFTTVIEHGLKGIRPLQYGQVKLGKRQQVQKNKQKESQAISYKIMIVRVVTGRSFLFNEKNKSENIPYQQKPQHMTQQFDSLILYNDNKQNQTQFKTQYIIYKAQQKCLPKYIVNFQIDNSQSHDKIEVISQKIQNIMCEQCDNNIANKYCQTQSTYFCIACDNRTHTNKVSHKHKRTDIANKTKLNDYCQYHNDIKYQLFCITCCRPLCVNCKIKGHHSEGDSLMHDIVRIVDRYNQQTKKMKNINKEHQKKKKYLISKAESIEHKLKEVNRKNNQAQEKIYQLMQNALKKLDSITKNKMAILMSDHIEIKRQLDYLQWLQKFAQYEHTILSPNQFLLSFELNNKLKMQILNKPMQLAQVNADIRIQGEVIVTMEEQIRKMGKDKKLYDGNSDLFSKNTNKISQILQNKFSEKFTDKMNEKNTDKNIQQNKNNSFISNNNLLKLSVLKHF